MTLIAFVLTIEASVVSIILLIHGIPSNGHLFSRKTKIGILLLLELADDDAQHFSRPILKIEPCFFNSNGSLEITEMS